MAAMTLDWILVHEILICTYLVKETAYEPHLAADLKLGQFALKIWT